VTRRGAEKEVARQISVYRFKRKGKGGKLNGKAVICFYIIREGATRRSTGVNCKGKGKNKRLEQLFVYIPYRGEGLSG